MFFFIIEERRCQTFITHAKEDELRNVYVAEMLALHGLFYSPDEKLVRCCSCFASLTPAAILDLINARRQRRTVNNKDEHIEIQSLYGFPHSTIECVFNNTISS